MKKKYLLLSGLILGSSMLFAQNFDVENVQYKDNALFQTDEPQKAFKQSKNMKAYGDTLYHETFDSNLNGWTVDNNTGNSNDWEWHNAAPGGQYSTNTGVLASSSGPGFIALRMDYINTPIPGPGPFTFDAWITSPAISISPQKSLYVNYEHAVRYCCLSSNELVLEVSPDSVHWTTYDAVGGRASNTTSPNAETISINVNDSLANSSTVYIRFRVTGSTHYYWMIDDVTITEGPKNGMELEDFDLTYHGGDYVFNPNYGMYPQDQEIESSHTAFTVNFGVNPQTNVRINTEVTFDSTLTGASGSGQVYSNDSLFAAVVQPMQRDSTSVNSKSFVATQKGYFSHSINVSSDSVNQFPIEKQAASNWFGVTDSTYSLDRGSFSGSGGPGGYVVGGADGDKVASLFIVEKKTQATSISIFVPSSRAEDVHQLDLTPIIYRFDEDTILTAGVLSLATYRSAFSSTSIYNSPFPETVDTLVHYDTWMTMVLTPAVTLEPGAYYVGVEQFDGASSGKKIWIGRDRSSEDQAIGISTAMNLIASQNPGWSTIPNILGIRMNTGNGLIGIDDNVQHGENIRFAVAPNPNSGEFKLFMNSDENATYTLNVRNMLGQTIHTEEISVDGLMTKNMNLNGYDKGVYFISLENDTERLVKKIVLN